MQKGKVMSRQVTIELPDEGFDILDRFSSENDITPDHLINVLVLAIFNEIDLLKVIEGLTDIGRQKKSLDKEIGKLLKMHRENNINV